jgi:hypothetical protein
MVRRNRSWVSWETEVEMPFGYTVSSSRPSGSRKIWWLVLSRKRTTLSSMEGQ